MSRLRIAHNHVKRNVWKILPSSGIHFSCGILKCWWRATCSGEWKLWIFDEFIQLWGTLEGLLLTSTFAWPWKKVSLGRWGPVSDEMTLAITAFSDQFVPKPKPTLETSSSVVPCTALRHSVATKYFPWSRSLLMFRTTSRWLNCDVASSAASGGGVRSVSGGANI